MLNGFRSSCHKNRRAPQPRASTLRRMSPVKLFFRKSWHHVRHFLGPSLAAIHLHPCLAYYSKSYEPLAPGLSILLLRWQELPADPQALIQRQRAIDLRRAKLPRSCANGPSQQGPATQKLILTPKELSFHIISFKLPPGCKRRPYTRLHTYLRATFSNGSISRLSLPAKISNGP